MSNNSAGRGQRLRQRDPLIVRERGGSEHADPAGGVLRLLPILNMGQDGIEIRRAALMCLAVTLDQLLTVGNLDGQGVILWRNARDEFQPALDSQVFLRVPQSLSAPTAQSGQPVELQEPADARSRDLPAARETGHPAPRRLRMQNPCPEPDGQRAAYLFDPRFHEFSDLNQLAGRRPNFLQYALRPRRA